MPKGFKTVICPNSECSNFNKPQSVNAGKVACGCGMAFPRKA